jgi:hypothetical protein
MSNKELPPPENDAIRQAIEMDRPMGRQSVGIGPFKIGQVVYLPPGETIVRLRDGSVIISTNNPGTR